MPARCLQENGHPRFTPADLQSHLSPMFENLFLAFQKPESGENEYLMKCVMRMITFVGQEVHDLPTHHWVTDCFASCSGFV